MYFYSIKVLIANPSNETIELETHRNFATDKDAYIFANGFAQGCVEATKGVLLDKQIQKLGDDRS